MIVMLFGFVFGGVGGIMLMIVNLLIVVMCNFYLNFIDGVLVDV